jgi:hypothetical protein
LVGESFGAGSAGCLLTQRIHVTVVEMVKVFIAFDSDSFPSYFLRNGPYTLKDSLLDFQMVTKRKLVIINVLISRTSATLLRFVL